VLRSQARAAAAAGWYPTLEDPGAPALSFALKTARRESTIAKSEHTIGVEIRAAWQDGADR